MNLFAFPGLGTVMARRRWGYTQSVLMVAGFCLAVIFMISYLREQLRQLLSSNPGRSVSAAEYAWMGWWGFGLCVVAWVWAALSSWNIWSDAQKARSGPGR